MTDNMQKLAAEFMGTAILITLGNGVVANVVLNKTKGQNSGWIVITFGWAMAVFVAVLCTADISGAHLNPAVTIALTVAHKFKGDWPLAMGYIAAQVLGAWFGAIIVWLFYRDHFDATPDGGAKLACFSTGPAIRNTANSFFCEVVGTFMLVLPIFILGAQAGYITDTAGHRIPFGLGAIGNLPIGLLILAIGLGLGGTTGFAINPARDLGPRIAHAILPIRGKGGSDWGYAWIPVFAPIVGGLLAAAAAQAFLAKG